ncbi:LacI family DNA-binding transcriptional regulator [Candidatus Sumerlaeota bacterium]|nr:LacI family DNA-binding transcriptional regulator [Candidatus Sumerlaeota bacterium]
MGKAPYTKRPTIRDIARLAGVSATTVSRVLNGDPRISESTAATVIKIAKQIHYRPNIMARALVKSGNRLVGLILRHIQGSFFSDIIAGVEEELEKRGYSVILRNSEMKPHTEKFHFKVLLDNQVEGIIITPITTEGINRKAYNEIVEANVPLIMLGNPKVGVKAPYVKVDNVLGGYLAGRHLVELGHRRIVYVSPNRQELFVHSRTLHSENLERYEGCRQVLREYGLLDGFSVVDAPNEVISEETVDRILSIKPLPTAIFTYSDMMAIKIIQLLKERNYSIPKDFSVVGYDDLDIAALVDPTLTTIAQPKKELGKIAALKLLGLIEGKTTMESIIKPKLIVRNSTSKPATRRKLY